MDQQLFNFLALIGTIISIIVFYYIVKVAVKNGTSRQRIYLKTQTDLLIEIALKHGVEEEKIEKIKTKLKDSLDGWE